MGHRKRIQGRVSVVTRGKGRRARGLSTCKLFVGLLRFVLPPAPRNGRGSPTNSWRACLIALPPPPPPPVPIIRWQVLKYKLNTTS